MTEPNFEPNSLFIKDNLDVMRGMNSECRDLIYLDPPFKEHKQVFRVEQWVCSQ